MTPRNRAWFVYGIALLDMYRLVVGEVRRRLNTMAVVFVGERVSPHVLDHSVSLSKAVCIVESASEILGEDVQNALSSAYSDVWTVGGKEVNKSLMNRVKRVRLILVVPLCKVGKKKSRGGSLLELLFGGVAESPGCMWPVVHQCQLFPAFVVIRDARHCQMRKLCQEKPLYNILC